METQKVISLLNNTEKENSKFTLNLKVTIHMKIQ